MCSFKQKLQDCFDSKDIQLLQDTLTTMPEEEARYHLKRCIDSGLWVPDARKDAAAAEEGAAGDSSDASKEPTENDDEEEYDEPSH